jgi:predicted acetyltransferase
VRRRRFRYNGAMEIEIRPMTPEHGDQFTRVMATAFGEEFTAEEVADHDRWFEYDRSIGAFDGDRLVGTGGAFSMDLTLPGLTTIPIGGLTAIAVLPTYRRRGILRSMIDYHFREVEERGELVSALGASESVIYGRFGYGLATTDASYEIDPRRAQFLWPPTGTGRLRLLDPEETAKVVPPLYDRYRRGQPGELTRPQAWWDVYARDPDWTRQGASRHYDVVYETDPGRVEGWLSYRVENRWPSGLAANIITVRMLVGLVPEAEAALWRYLFDMDLAGTIKLSGRSLDDPVRWRLADPRRLRITDVGDHLWVRLLDVPGALAARRYAVADTLVLEVTDALRPRNQGRFRLEGGPDGASCEPTAAPPDLALDVADLGAAYLGGTSLVSLARAERVGERTPGALIRAERMFASSPGPICTTYF